MVAENVNESNDMNTGKQELSAETERQIIEAVKGIRYGSVEITIQDGKVVQIERKEKVRLNK